MNQWSELAKNWQQYESPLRPNQEDVSAFENAVTSCKDVLLLGVTPELQRFCTLAVDNNADAILIHKAKEIGLLADWRNLPLPSNTFDAVIGDGSLNVLSDGYSALFAEMKRVLKPNGKMTLRVFCKLENTPSIETILQGKDALKFHAFKLSVSTALANPYVSVKEIQKHVKQVWDHPTLQFNRDSNAIYYFPKLSELPPFTDIKYPGTYQLANQCPIITWSYKDLERL